MLTAISGRAQEKAQARQDPWRPLGRHGLFRAGMGLSEEHEGIILFPEDAPVGTPLRTISTTKSWKSS
ncbi:MAG: hypothetical protein R2867_35640 [Caldilineaceae bacterium]